MVLIGRRQLRSNNSWMHNIPQLVKGKERCTAHVHPDDAERFGLIDGEQAQVTSRAGSIVVTVEVTDAHDARRDQHPARLGPRRPRGTAARWPPSTPAPTATCSPTRS